MNEDFQEYMIQANALMGQEKYEDAIKYFEKAEQIDNMNIDVYLSKGVAYANLESYEPAKLEFEKVLKISKNNGIALFHLGNIEILSGNRARGIELFNNAIANGFDDAQVYFSLGLMHEEADSDELAIRNYSKAILKDSNRADIRIRKVRLLIKNNLLPEALQTIDELILSNPDVFEGYHLKFLVLVSQEKYDDAENVINDEEREYLELQTRARTIQAQTVTRAQILLLRADSVSIDAIADKVGLNRCSVMLCLKKFKEGGIENAFFDATDRGRNAEIIDEEKA